jgi:hypothetical protein
MCVLESQGGTGLRWAVSPEKKIFLERKPATWQL